MGREAMPAIINIKDIMEKAGGEEAIELMLRRFDDDVHYMK